MIFFFFSSRRRHTRFDCDWSSDVCSSDLFFRRDATDVKHNEAVLRYVETALRRGLAAGVLPARPEFRDVDAVRQLDEALRDDTAFAEPVADVAAAAAQDIDRGKRLHQLLVLHEQEQLRL